MKKNRVIIAGSRSCPESDHDLFVKVTDVIKSLKREDTEIVSGTARGADRFGEWSADTYEIPIKRFPVS